MFSSNRKSRARVFSRPSGFLLAIPSPRLAVWLSFSPLRGFESRQTPLTFSFLRNLSRWWCESPASRR